MRTLRYAFIKSLPVMFGYLFLGIAFGIVLTDEGYGPLWAALMSVFVYAGSMQFVMVPLMASGASIATMLLMTLFVNIRHIFYGLSFTESFSKMRTKLYMIFGLTDETYSVLTGCRTEDPEEKMRSSWFFITLFDQLYWITGSMLGAILGSFIPFDLSGIDFSMTALFAVILTEQILSGKKNAYVSALIGILVSIVCLLIFGKEVFLIPTLIITVLFVASVNAFPGRKEAQNG